MHVEIENCPGFYISDGGKVYHGEGRKIVHTHIERYVKVWLTINGRRRNMYVHKLVLEAFVGPRPKGKECRHIDGDKPNCNLSNLKWGTRKENMADRVRLGETGNKARIGEAHGRAKLTDIKVIRIRKLRNERLSSFPELATLFGVSKSQIRNVVYRRAWTHT